MLFWQFYRKTLFLNFTERNFCILNKIYFQDYFTKLSTLDFLFSSADEKAKYIKVSRRLTPNDVASSRRKEF